MKDKHNLFGRQKENMTEYNQKAIDAICELQNTIDSLGISKILVRKLNGIRNAIEMQVEDHRVLPEALDRLYKVYLAQTEIFKEPYRSNIINALHKCENVIKQCSV